MARHVLVLKCTTSWANEGKPCSDPTKARQCGQTGARERSCRAYLPMRTSAPHELPHGQSTTVGMTLHGGDKHVRSAVRAYDGLGEYGGFDGWRRDGACGAVQHACVVGLWCDCSRRTSRTSAALACLRETAATHVISVTQ